MPTPSPDALLAFQERQLQAAGYGGPQAPIRYRLMRPAEVRLGETYPLVVFLHGAGERGDDNRSQLKYLPDVLAAAPQRKRFPCFAIAPQCPADDFWVRLDWSDPDAVPQAAPSAPLAAVRSILAQTLASEPIDPARVYLTGLSMGGFGAWHLAATNPDDFAALAPVCGGGDPAWAAALKDLPIWAVHGEADDVVPVGHSRKMIAAIEAVGGKPKYTELQGVGHDSWTPASAPEFGLLDWLFEQRRSSGGTGGLTTSA